MDITANQVFQPKTEARDSHRRIINVFQDRVFYSVGDDLTRSVSLSLDLINGLNLIKASLLMKLTSKVQNEIQKLKHKISITKSAKDKKILQEKIGKVLKP